MTLNDLNEGKRTDFDPPTRFMFVEPHHKRETASLVELGKGHRRYYERINGLEGDNWYKLWVVSRINRLTFYIETYLEYQDQIRILMATNDGELTPLIPEVEEISGNRMGWDSGDGGGGTQIRLKVTYTLDRVVNTVLQEVYILLHAPIEAHYGFWAVPKVRNS